MADKITQGQWTWDPELLMSKIIEQQPDECWGWRGSRGPNANLFGARKNDRPQMTQAARLIWMTHTGRDVQDLEVRHTCGNRFCTNFQHMTTRPNHLRYHRDGRPLGTPRVKPQAPLPTIKTRKMIAVTEELRSEQVKQKPEPWWKICLDQNQK